MTSSPVDLFERMLIHAGEVAEFPVEIGGYDFCLVIPGRRQPVAIIPAYDRILVPHYEIVESNTSAHLAVDMVSAEVYGDAWRLLEAAARRNVVVEEVDEVALEKNIRRLFAIQFGILPHQVKMKMYRRKKQVMAVFQNRGGCLLMTVHDDLLLVEEPGQQVTASIDLGFAVMDIRVVLEGRLKTTAA
jgi:hypothetical protein